MTESAQPRQKWKVWFVVSAVVFVAIVVAIAWTAATTSAKPHPAWGTNPTPVVTQSE